MSTIPRRWSTRLGRVKVCRAWRRFLLLVEPTLQPHEILTAWFTPSARVSWMRSVSSRSNQQAPSGATRTSTPAQRRSAPPQATCKRGQAHRALHHTAAARAPHTQLLAPFGPKTQKEGRQPHGQRPSSNVRPSGKRQPTRKRTYSVATYSAAISFLLPLAWLIRVFAPLTASTMASTNSSTASRACRHGEKMSPPFMISSTFA